MKNIIIGCQAMEKILLNTFKTTGRGGVRTVVTIMPVVTVVRFDLAAT